MNIEQIAQLVAQKSSRSIEALSDGSLGELLEIDAHSDIRDYLHYCLSEETYLASRMRVLGWEGIKREMGEGAAPGSFIRPFGYLIFATSVGGNVLCLHQKTGRVFWADHDSFSDDMIMFQDRMTRSYEYLYEFTAENVERAMVLIADNFEDFLKSFLADGFTAQLEGLDS